MVRRDQAWENRAGGYIETTNPLGYDVLINGTDKYLNFNLISGSLGYGFRDNAGVMEFKNSAGAWANFGAGGGSVTIGTPVVGGNPGRILYIDQSGNLFGDDAAVRDSGVQKQTTIGSGTYAQAEANDGVSADVYFQADVIGDTGNSISLVFDGIDDADTVLNAWNTANPGNTASIIDGVGTTVPTAGTMIFVGGGTVLYESGTINNGITPAFQGSGAGLQDITNSKFCFSDTGNLTTIIGEPSLGFIAAGIDGNTGNLGAMVVSDSGINFFVTDQSTYNARLQGDDVEIILVYNGTYLGVNGLSGPLWGDSSSNRYILPTNVTPSVGDTLAVAGISGNDYALDFVAGGVTIGNAVGGGSPNEILFADGSTKVAQSSDLFFDATKKIFRVGDISGTSNGVTFVLDDTIPAIKSMFADGIGTFEISGTGGNRLFLATASNGSFQAGDVDLVSGGALLLVNSSFGEVKNVGDYYRFSPIGALFDYLFEINSSAKTTKIGDVAGIANSTLLTVDDTNSRITVSKPFGLKGYTVATLPTGFTGATAYVTDALAPAFGSTVVGGGAVVIKVFYNGSNRIVG